MPVFERFKYFDESANPFEESPRFHAEEAGESLAATLAAIFASRGDDFAVGLLVNSSHRIEEWTIKGTGLFSKYRWIITVPPSLYALYHEQEQSEESHLDMDERDDFLIRAWSLGGPLMENIQFSDIVVTPELSVNPEWRKTARSHLAGAGVNNQGNVQIQKRPKILYDELWFRHIEEQYIYEALLRRRNPFLPLPVCDARRREKATEWCQSTGRAGFLHFV